jgi:isochorismate hydrolase
VRDAHVRDFAVIVLGDGCAAFSEQVHEEALAGLRPVAPIVTVADALTAVRAA